MTVLVDSARPRGGSDSGLVSWIMTHVNTWEQHRNQNFAVRWAEYYRMWRGIWAEEDRARKSERSRMIAPALAQAVEAAVAEQEEATFGRERWIDVSDDILDPEKEDVSAMLTQLLEDFTLAGVPAVVSETYLNGALYGTGIAKVMVDTHTHRVPMDSADGGVQVLDQDQVIVRLVAIDPREFVIDPAARSIDDGLGCAHVTLVPLHSVAAKQASGVYMGDTLSSYRPDSKFILPGELGTSAMDGFAKIVEWHGLVPRGYLSGEEPVDMMDLVEAIVTIGNDSTLLRALENPFLMKDRSFIAYPHDKVPNRFWGRGVAEKGYNPAKQLDAELRARVDALAFSVHPMIGISAGALPRGETFQVRPGRTILTTGNPREQISPIQFPPPDPQTYRQAAEMERMVQMGTGAMDSAAPIGVSPRNNTASGMSMMLAGSLKRSKRTMQNIERYFLRPLVEKALWRYMQYETTRYPARDYKFVVRSTMGIMAREVEQQLLTSLAATTPPASPAYWVILKAIFETSTVSVKGQILQTLEQLTAEASQPKAEQEPDLNAQANMARVQLDTQVHQDKMRVEVERLKLESRKLDQIDRELMIKWVPVQAEIDKTAAEQTKIGAEAYLAETKANVAIIKSELDTRQANFDAAERRALQVSSALQASLEAHGRALRNSPSGADMAEIKAKLSQLRQPPAPAPAQAPQPSVTEVSKRRPVRIERDPRGRVSSVDGMGVLRDDAGLIVGLEE